MAFYIKDIACDDLDFLAKQNHTYDIIYCMDQAISTSSMGS